MSFSTYKQTISLLLIILFVFSTVIAEEATNIEQNLSPADVHQILWQEKASALSNKAINRTLSASTEANTQPNYDMTFYDIFIRVNDTTEMLYGSVRFVGKAAENSVSEIQVDYYSNMAVDSIVHSTGQLAYSRNANVVTITLDHAYAIEEEFDFTFYYSGHPVEGGFQAFEFGFNGADKIISSLSEPYFARTWWPCKDRMDDKADSFKIALQVDTSLYAASNGSLDSTILNGDNTHTFYYQVRYPMATYLFSVAISNYTVWYDEWVYNSGLDTLPLVHAVYPSQYTYSLGKYNITPDALTYLSANFGTYPFPEEKYGHANFNWGGGMEHQTMTSMTGSWFGFYEPVVVHELGHQWTGDLITCNNWGHIWLNEGWASYSEAMYYLERDGWSAYHSYMAGMEYGGGGSIYIYDTTNVGAIFGSIVYDKGAWVCHMLRGVLGDSLFFAGLDAYMNSEYRFGSATTEQFRDVYEAATGVELDWFFEDWIYGTYRPNYRFSYFQEPSAVSGYDLYLKVEQTQTSSPNIFRMPVDFAVSRAAILAADTVTLVCDEREKVFQLNFPTQITDVELDPANWVLNYLVETSWSFTIITTDADLQEGVQYGAYVDTIKGVGTSNTTTAIISGALPNGYSLANSGIISGTTSDTGSFTFSIQMLSNDDGTYDLGTFTIYVAPITYIPGDIDGSLEINIADLVMLVSYMFDEGPAPLSMNAADVNSDCTLDIADLVYLVNYQFDSGPEPLAGCIE